MTPNPSDPSELYAALGGSDQPLIRLVDAFYAGVETKPALRALYPDDLADAKQHLAWFLIQRFGGPDHFTQRRGAPMLRRRHVMFAITPDIAESWFAAMRAALDTVDALAPHREILLRYFEDAAVFLINKPGRLGAEIAMQPVASEE